MSRILYLLFSTGGLTGGQKMVVRHVETLRDLGFDAAVMLGVGGAPPRLSHRAPILPAIRPDPGDVVVIPNDAEEALELGRLTPERSVIFDQNPLHFAEGPIARLDAYPPDALPPLITVAPGAAATLRRLYPKARIEVVPCFADERVFRPSERKVDAVSCTPRKREREVKMIHNLFRRLHPVHADLRWGVLRDAPEDEVARVFGVSRLHLALSRLESVGITTLEAMASGCVCAGFLGVGGAEFATPENGFWAPDDDCVAAADALARAADVVRVGGPALAARVEAGRETARQWSYARFRVALEEVWMALAPEARVRSGPLDALKGAPLRRTGEGPVMIGRGLRASRPALR